MVNKDFEKSAVKHSDSRIFSRADMEEVMGDGYERALPNEETISLRLKRLFGMSTRDRLPLSITYRDYSTGGRKLGDTMILRDSYGGSTYMKNVEAGIFGHTSLSKFSGGNRRGVGPVGLISLLVTREGANSFNLSGGFQGIGLKRAKNVSTRDDLILTMQALANIQRSIDNGENFDYDALREDLIERGYEVDDELTAQYLKNIEIRGQKIDFKASRNAGIDAPENDDTEPA